MCIKVHFWVSDSPDVLVVSLSLIHSFHFTSALVTGFELGEYVIFCTEEWLQSTFKFC